MSDVMLRVREDDISWAPTDEDAIVLLDLRTSRYLSLNTSGSALWLRLVDGAAREDLHKTLIDRFAIAESAAQADVEIFLSALRERDLLAE